MRPCCTLGTPATKRPIDLARRARAEGLGQRRRRKARLGDEQAAGGVLVEPVHEPRPLAVRVAQHFEHAVEMARGAGAALHRKPHRLVEHQHVGVFVERDRFEKRAGLLVRLAARRARLFGASSRSGGMRTVCPASSRFFGCVRLPLTRTSPLRMTRWMWEKLKPGNRASRKRSTRMPASSAVTATFCTPVGVGAGAIFLFPSS